VSSRGGLGSYLGSHPSHIKGSRNLGTLDKLSLGSATLTGALPLISRPNSSILPVAVVHYSRSKCSYTY
jgi:hypothetical protein